MLVGSEAASLELWRQSIARMEPVWRPRPGCMPVYQLRDFGKTRELRPGETEKLDRSFSWPTHRAVLPEVPVNEIEVVNPREI